MSNARVLPFPPPTFRVYRGPVPSAMVRFDWMSASMPGLSGSDMRGGLDPGPLSVRLRRRQRHRGKCAASHLPPGKEKFEAPESARPLVQKGENVTTLAAYRRQGEHFGG